MAVRAIQPGQVWRHDDTGQVFLVTKLYNEVFAEYVILRRADADAASEQTLRLKVIKTSEGATLPGYTFTQDTHDF